MKFYIAVLITSLISLKAQSHEWLSDIFGLEVEEGFFYKVVSYEEFASYYPERQCNVKDIAVQLESQYLGGRDSNQDNEDREAGRTDYKADDIGTCEEFDHYTIAQVAAIMKCAGLDADFDMIAANPHYYFDGFLVDIEEVMSGPFPKYLGPESFVTEGGVAEDHDAGYRLSDGLKFYCVIRVDEVERSDDTY